MFGVISIFVLCFASALVGVSGQEGQVCRTSLNQNGYCISIYNCDFMLNLLRTRRNDPQVRNYLLGSTCGYAGTIALVCCPTFSRNVPSSPRNPVPPASITPAPTPAPVIIPNNPPPITNPNVPAGLVTLPRPIQCGFSNNSIGKIVGGSPANKGEFPWIAALGYRNTKNPDSPKWLCGGSLITWNHILTAGHCVHGRDDLYLARLGEIDLYSDTDGANPITIPISKRKVHEEYNPSSHTNDIAVLKLEFSPTIPGIWPICLPIDDPLRSNQFTGYLPFVAGWGSVYFNGPSSATLQKVQVPVVTTERCKTAFSAFKNTIIDDRVICAGYDKGGKDSCQGDSGGPLMYATSRDVYNEFYMIGVVSYGFRCGEPGYPAVYTRVTSFLDWIGRNLD